MTQHEHSIVLDVTDPLSIGQLRGSHFVQVTLTNFNQYTRLHNELKCAAEKSVASSRGVVVLAPRQHP